MKRLLCSLFVLALASSSSTALAQRPGGPPGRGGDHGPLEVHEPPTGAGIAWFGTWAGALAEAQRTGRPILLQSAAPQCHSVPGVW